MKILVVGAGPAGMMAAIHAINNDNQVTIIEANGSLGKKLLLTGNGRCNIANNKPNYQLIKILHNGKFMTKILNNFDINFIHEFYANKGLDLVEEVDNKLYPITQKSASVLDVFKDYLNELNITVRYNSRLDNFKLENGKITSLIINGKTEYYDHIIFASGGLSFPNIGSDGHIHNLLKANNIKYSDNYPVEAPLFSNDKIVKDKELLGLSFKDVKLSLYSSQSAKIIDSIRNDLIFTHKGLSGPGALILSETVYKLIEQNKSPYLAICFLNDLKQSKLAEIIANSDQSIRNVLYDYLPKRLVNYMLNINNIDPHTHTKQVSNLNKEKLYEAIYRFKIQIDQVAPLKQAFITGGGISLDELSDESLVLHKITNLSLCGEMLDIHGPIGGYNLLIAQVSGAFAGSYVKTLKKD